MIIYFVFGDWQLHAEGNQNSSLKSFSPDGCNASKRFCTKLGSQLVSGTKSSVSVDAKSGWYFFLSSSSKHFVHCVVLKSKEFYIWKYQFVNAKK